MIERWYTRHYWWVNWWCNSAEWLFKNQRPSNEGKAMFISDEKEISWNDGRRNISRKTCKYTELHKDSVGVEKRGKKDIETWQRG